eukprot:274845_1
MLVNMKKDLSASVTIQTQGNCAAIIPLNLLVEKLKALQFNPKHLSAEQRQPINVVSDILSPSPTNGLPCTESKAVMSHAVVAQQLPRPSVFVTAYESYQTRRIVSNILLILFLQHPIGVLETELSLFYQQCFNEPFVLSSDLRYLLSVHKAIICTQTANRGALFTLNTDEIEFILTQFEPQTLRAAVVYHIHKIFRCYPNGIACGCFPQVFHNMVQIRLSKIVSSWFKFVHSIPSIYCISIGGDNVFIQMNNAHELSRQYEEIGCFLMHHLNADNVLKHCYGYDELLMALFGEQTPMNGAQMEQMFYKLYKCRLVYEAPFIRSKLKGICDTHGTSNGGTLYSLSSEYIAYMKDNAHGFNAIRKRELQFNKHVQKKNQQKRCGNVKHSIIKSPFSADHCTVFLGGFCKGDSAEKLKSELCEMGVDVVSCSGILYRSYGWAYVTLSNAKECDYLLERSPIYVLRRSVDVRPYLDRYKASPKMKNKPLWREMRKAIRRFIRNARCESLSIAELQSRLFRKYSYRISGPEIIQLVSNNPNLFYVRSLPGQPNSPQIYIKSVQ